VRKSNENTVRPWREEKPSAALDFFDTFCIKAKRKERTPSRQKEKNKILT